MDYNKYLPSKSAMKDTKEESPSSYKTAEEISSLQKFTNDMLEGMSAYDLFYKHIKPIAKKLEESPSSYKEGETKEEILKKHTHNVALLDRLTKWHWSFVLKAMEEYASKKLEEYRNSNQGGWVSVKERLPRHDEEILFINTDLKMVSPSVHAGYYNAATDGFYSWLDTIDRFKATHWQPLPPLPLPPK